MGDCVIEHEDGAVIFVRATANGRQDSILGRETRADGKTYLKLKTSAVPEAGRANEAIIKLLAKFFDIPKSKFSILSGQTSREKTILVNAPKTDIEARLQNL